ncbi:MAG: TetR/AcrR family transcriptional regulator [Cyanobacteria bacterium P01_C01_bin.69]
MPTAENASASRSEEILSVAQNFIQSRGYNGFSYRDIAAEIGIKSASIHYHFPTKGDLGKAVTARYTEQFGKQLQRIEASADTAHERLKKYATLFRDTLIERHLLCMCGMLAGDIETLPELVKLEVAHFFEAQQQWLTGVITTGKTTGEISPAITAAAWATTLLAALEGAMLVSRGLDQNDQFDIVTDALLSSLFKSSKTNS